LSATVQRGSTDGANRLGYSASVTRLDRTAAPRASSVASAFERRVGQRPRLFQAPGRVNLIGEHTDYNEGFALPVALDLVCYAAVAVRSDRRIIVHSMNREETIETLIDAPATRTGSWRDYVAGVTVMLRDHGVSLRGVDVVIDSGVPAGAGLSSSAALEVAIAMALLDAADETLDPTVLAHLCRRAENEVVGAACGIMDQYVACHARAGTAMLLDCGRLEHHYIPLPRDVRIVACNTMVRHAIATGEYNRRRAECSQAVRQIARVLPGIRSLRDVGIEHLSTVGGATDPILFKRIRHVVTENRRAHRMAAALDAGDLAALAPLMTESQRSLRDDFNVSCPELDALVEVAAQLPGVYGARMTGGGFGGSTVNLVAAEAVSAFCATVPELYHRRTGLTPDIYVASAAGAAGPAGT